MTQNRRRRDDGAEPNRRRRRARPLPCLFYPSVLLESVDEYGLAAEHVGAIARLVQHWLTTGAIPSTAIGRRHVVEMSAAEFDRVWPAIARFFDSEGRCVHPAWVRVRS